MSRLNLSGIVVLVLSVFLWGCSSEESGLEVSAKQEKEIAERIAPAGEVVKESDLGTVAAADAGGAEKSGADVYQASCAMCHNTGAAGAPKVGDAAVWTDRLAQGIDALHANAINGIRGMPPRGTCMACSDSEIIAAVDHMLENSQ